MTSTFQLEVLDLRHFSARQLRPLLEQESRLWSERLRWDYRSSADLLLQYLDARVLPGFVALDRGRVCGYIFCVHEGSKAVIGDVFAVADASSQPTVDVENTLLTHLLEMLQNSPNVSRIEAQLLLHGEGLHKRPFLQNGFRIYPRLFMECEVGAGAADASGGDGAAARDQADALVQTAPGIELRKWSPEDFTAAGELIQQCYLGHLDSRINNQYRSVAGSLRFLHNIVRFPGCGVFDAETSLVLHDASSGGLIGLLLCSRVRQDVAHITQICVAQNYRRRKLGKLLVQECLGLLKERGFSALTLTVTAANRDAVALYESFGFKVAHRFDAMVWDPEEA